MMRLLIVFIVIITMSACEDKIVLDPEKVNRIEYSFHDSSVPPPYHRSYDIIVTANNIKLQVDSYGDVLVDTTFKNTRLEFDKLIDLINNSNLKSGDDRSEPGCTGGTSEELLIFEDNQKVCSSYFEHCGGKTLSKKFGDYESVINAIKELIPDLAEFLK